MESLVPPDRIYGWDGQSNRPFVCSLTPLDGQSNYAQELDIVVDSIPCPMPDVFRWCIEITGKRPNEFQQVLTQHLTSRGVPLAIRNDIVPYISNYTARCEVLGVSVDVISYYSLYVESDEEMDEELDTVTELSMEDSLKPTPASREAVEALEKVMVKGEESETRCVVCLEGFELGLVAKKMPCEHVFHGECIDRWLEKRHLCPLYRYELPSSS